jgi:hypothetical protein
MDVIRKEENERLKQEKIDREKEKSKQKYLMKKQQTIKLKEMQRALSTKEYARSDSAGMEGNIMHTTSKIDEEYADDMSSVGGASIDSGLSSKVDASLPVSQSVSADYDDGTSRNSVKVGSVGATGLSASSQDTLLPAMVMGDVDLSTLCPPGLEYNYSEEILKTAYNIINFTLFSGYNNLRMDQLPDERNYAYENKEDENTIIDDDKWLTHSFFLNITKDRVDGIREATTKPIDSYDIAFGTHPLNTVKLSYEAIDAKDYLEHKDVSVNCNID